MNLREFVLANSIHLPPISLKVLVGDPPAEGPDTRSREFDPAMLQVELAGYRDVAARYLALFPRRFKSFVLGKKGILKYFGPVVGTEICEKLDAGSVENAVLRTVLAEMQPGMDGVELGGELGDAATGLLDVLQQSLIITAEQRAVLDNLRTEVNSLDPVDVWNELHTWEEGRP